MPTPIAKLYSTIDSMKRVLADRLAAGPVEDLKKTLSRAGEDAAKFRETQKRGGPAATEAMLETVLNLMPGGGAAGTIAKAYSGATTRAQIKEAEELLAAGLPGEAYNKLGMFRDERLSPELLKVIDDTQGVMAVSKLRQSPTGAVELRGHASAKELATPGGRSFYSGSTLPTLYDHPELYEVAPWLKETVAVRGLTGINRAAPTSSSAQYSPSLNAIVMGNFPSSKEFQSALLHEINHAVASKQGLPRGSSTAIQYGGSQNAKEFLAAKKQTDQLDRLHPDRLKMQQVAKDAFNAYLGDPGELMSRITQQQFESNLYHVSPSKFLDHTGKGSKTYMGPPETLSNDVQELILKYALNL